LRKVVGFKSGAFDRWVDGVNTSSDRLIELLGDNYGLFYK